MSCSYCAARQECSRPKPRCGECPLAGVCKHNHE
ncbi:MAG: hypothetical protein ACYC05_08960 [Sulfuricella sp.]